MAITKKLREDGSFMYYQTDIRLKKTGRRVREFASIRFKEAEAIHDERKRANRAGQYVPSREQVDEVPAIVDLGPTFGKFCERFLRDYTGRRSRGRRSTHYEMHLRFAGIHFKDRPLRSITRADFDLYKTARAAAFAEKHGGAEIGAGTLKKELTALGTLLQVAVEWGELVSSPATRLPKPKEPTHDARPLARDEWERVHAEAPEWLRPMMELAVTTGLRLKEVVGVRWKDVNFTAKQLRVNPDSKTGEADTIPLNGSAIAVLLEQDGRNEREHVFCTAAGLPYTSTRSRNHISKTTIATMERCGIAAGFHDLRHTFGTWQAAAGRAGYLIQRLMRHADPRMTQRYIELTDTQLAEAAEATETRAVDTQRTPNAAGTAGAGLTRSA